MKSRSAVWPAIVLILAILFTGKPRSLYAQSQCSRVTNGAYATSPIQFYTYAELMAGGTATRYLTVQIIMAGNGISCGLWSLKVKASGDFSNGRSSVPLNHTAVRFNVVVGGPSGEAIGVSRSPFPLSTSQVTIIEHSNAPISSDLTNYFEIKYDLMIEGGAHLLVPNNGEYQTNLSFYLYAGDGSLISVASTPAKFQIYYAPNDNASLTLRNGATDVSLKFRNARDLENGVSDVYNSGMQVDAPYGHQVIVKASSNSLVTPGISYQMPISVINLTLSSAGGQGDGSGIVCYSVQLSTVSQVVVHNPVTDYRFQSERYTLRYSIEGGNDAVSRGPPGVYMASIVFAIVPL
jgi:hypothetical protein